MIKILFICHGNICRSPMAEFIFKDMVERDNKNLIFVMINFKNYMMLIKEKS